MSEERLKVLGMLASGRITVEQSNRLLEVLGVADLPADAVERESVPEAASDDRGDATESGAFGRFTFDQILQMGTCGVDPAFFDEVREAGLTDLSFDQILQMGAVGVDPAFVAQTREAGLGLAFDEILQLGTVGVEPSFVARVREVGLTDLSFDQILQMGAVGVDPEFVLRMRELNVA